MIGIQTLKDIELSFRQFGYEAEDVFNALAACYMDTYNIQKSDKLTKIYEKGKQISDRVFKDTVLREIVSNKEYEKLRKIVETDWHISAVIILPEGIFQSTANTTTRADILVLDKKGTKNSKTKTIFSNIASVGVPLKAKQKQVGSNDLQEILQSKEVADILGIAI